MRPAPGGTSSSGLWTALVAGAVLLAAFAIPAPPPAPEAPAPELAAFLEERRGRLLWSSGLIATGGVFYVWFLCAVACLPAAEPRSAADAASVVSGAAGAAVLVAGGALQSALVLQSADASEELLRFGFDAYNALVTVAGAFFGAAVAALALSVRVALPTTIFRAAWVVAPLQFLTLFGLARAGGFFAAGGTMALIAFWSLVAWYVSVALHLMHRSRPTATAA